MFKLVDMLRAHLPEATETFGTAMDDDIANYMGDIQAELFSAANARQHLPDLRELAENGAAAVIADRGQIGGLQDTTLMISAQTFAMMIAKIIMGEQARHANREPATALLAGLMPTSPWLGKLVMQPLAGDAPGIGFEHIDLAGEDAVIAE